MMYREQVYNAAGWAQRQPSPLLQTNRRLNRGIHRNLGLLDKSRNSNPSTSLRMKRTEVSADRSHHSRDRELNSQQTSGITSEAFNDSVRRIPKSIGSLQSLSRRKLPREGNNFPMGSSRSGRHIVENLYMLTNNAPQYVDRYQQPHRSPEPYEQHYSPRDPYQKNGRYERVGERRPERNSPHPERYPQRSSKQRYLERNTERQHSRNQDRQPQSDKYHQKYNKQPERHQNRAPSPNRGSVLRSRRSRDKNIIQAQRPDQIEANYKKIGKGTKDPYRNNPDHQPRRHQEKYLENVYQLNSPRNARDQLDFRQRQVRPGGDKYYRQKQKVFPDRGSKQRGRYAENRHYKNEPRGYPQQRYQYPQKPYRDGGHPRQYDEQDRYRQERDYYRQKGYDREYEETEIEVRKRNYQPNSGYSAKNNKRNYYYEDQIPSTTAGVKTLPEVSRYDTISDASIPLNSIGSQRQLPKNTIASQVPHKNSVKLDRPKEKHLKNNKERPNQRAKEKRYDQSNIQAKLQKNKIHLQERRGQRWDDRNKKTIQEKYKTQNLPSGSVFLPVQSKRVEKNQWADDVLERVILHLQSLNLIADYTKDFKRIYENVQPWQVLIFLTYKKFYIERTKAVNILKPPEPKNNYSESVANLEIRQNPFTLPYSKVSDKEIEKFCTTRECLALIIELESQNAKIRNALRSLYNLYIQKSGEHVNMLDCDNFSDQIYRLMKQELDGISQNLQDPDLVLPTKLRMGKIIKVGLLIAFLNGKYIKNFSQIIIHQDLIKVGKRETLREDNIVQLFLEQFKKVVKL